MIVKKNFNPLKVVSYVWAELLVSVMLSGTGWFLFTQTSVKTVALPFAPLGVMGTALAIFLGFRNNNAYARWWEARTVWANTLVSSRTIARQISASVANALAVGKVDSGKLRQYEREMIFRQIAFAHALRLQLRDQQHWDDLKPWLPVGEYNLLITKQNKANALLQTQAIRLKDGVREEMVGAFDPISLEPGLVAFNNQQGASERIKTTPLPRQYDYFTRVFLWAFLGLLPFSLLSFFNTPQTAWLSIPVTLVIAFIYAIINKTGAVLENPFENQINDVPLSAICTTIERDLLEMLGETNLPAPAAPRDGYLF